MMDNDVEADDGDTDDDDDDENNNDIIKYKLFIMGNVLQPQNSCNTTHPRNMNCPKHVTINALYKSDSK